MQKLTQQEHKIYSEYILEELTNAFSLFGSVSITDLRDLIHITYEISDITNLIFPQMEISESFMDLETLNKVIVHNQPNDLLERFTIEQTEAPSVFYVSRARGQTITPYDSIYINEEYFKSIIINSPIEMIQTSILTNGKKTIYQFMGKEYELPFDYSRCNETEIEECRDNIKDKLQQELSKIKPIDNTKMTELVNQHYNTR